MVDELEPMQLSGLQHFAFCRRQWALIHIEQQWAENLRTAEGDLFHRRAHEGDALESRGDTLIARGLRVFSRKLNAVGICDVVEFHRDDRGVALFGRAGRWTAAPVEYKKGAPKITDADRLQLCAQAICLEEMLACEIPQGFLFYGETRRREAVELTPALRGTVEDLLREMQALYARGHTPAATPGKACNACSLKEICLPGLKKAPATADYLRRHLREDEEKPQTQIP